MKTNKLLTFTAVSAVLFSASASAALLPEIGFSPTGSANTPGSTYYANTWTYATDRGVDIKNTGPGDQNQFTVGDQHTFTTQMAINSFQTSIPQAINGGAIGYLHSHRYEWRPQWIRAYKSD